ncbi:zinc finger BED domain-containing protein 4-like [Coccinella septempunctata]|uniref:zinc finger BED domain-containing protein 4-like n=1 Tax=Coccinella septempunctata TaxID=41139 RepID=UPI001D07CF77|nr:zinc finger BED domain-containing protein 4-like [Coccinella septempunctata]
MSAKQTIQVWLHFSKPNGEKRVKCLYCGQQLSVLNNSTGPLIRHLSRKHPTQQLIRRSSPQITTERREISASSSSTSATETVPAAASLPLANRNISQAVGTTTRPVYEYFTRPLPSSKQREIDRQLISMITKEYHPFSLVEDEEFKKLVKLLSPSYNLPTRQTVSHALIPTIYKETVDIVESRLARASAICLTMDGWCSRNNDSFFNITAHYIVEDNDRTFLSSDLLGCDSYTDRHTGENICEKINQTLSRLKIDNRIAAIVTDNASNMKLGVRTGGWCHWGCFAHSLNLRTQSGLKEKEVQVVVDKIKAIVRYFHKSSHVLVKIKEMQERLGLPIWKLKNDVPTRWNYTYDMIRRVLSMKNALISTVAMMNCCNVEMLSNEEWAIAEQSMDILSMFDMVTKTISAQKSVTLSSLIIYYTKLSRHQSSTNSSNLLLPVENLRHKLSMELLKRFGDIEDNELVSQATILDPRFKKFGFNDLSRYNKTVQSMYHKVANIKCDDITTSDLQEKSADVEKNPKTDKYSAL